MKFSKSCSVKIDENGEPEDFDYLELKLKFDQVVLDEVIL